ncbi:MAG: hypothetical protein GF411_17580 [Candidatus Lokiarchaeota archaeon]|nr:hypothetical protein [Candidatus Lokiarchaeota archaeon]
MTRQKILVVLFLLVLSYAPIFGSAQNLQGIEWGIEENTRYEFHLIIRNPGGQFIGRNIPQSLEIDLYAVFEDVPNIPNDMTSSYFPIISAQIYFQNGSSFQSLSVSPLFSAVPVGNWTHIQSIFEEYDIQDTTYFQDAGTWGVEQQSWIANYRYNSIFVFSKEDGANTLFEYIITDSSDNSEVLFLQVSRGNAFDPVIVVSAIVIGVEVGAVILIIAKVKGKR